MMSLPLDGKIAIVTGANQGFGLELSRRYVRAGASLVICARNGELLAKARQELSPGLMAGQLVEAEAADVSNPVDAERVVKIALDRFGHVDILVNNAGVYGPMGPIETVDWAQWRQAIEINLFGSILMCRAVLPSMKSQRHGKIIQLSGGGATNPMPNLSAYAAAKAAVVRFAETLAGEVRAFNIDVNSIAPGALNTRMLDEVLAAGPEQVGQAFFDRAVQQQKNGGAGFDRGADVAVFLASDASDGITGKLISAVWDNWENWSQHLEELQRSDTYTLRRITGGDRHQTWGDK